jgi:hypothetical protein
MGNPCTPAMKVSGMNRSDFTSRTCTTPGGYRERK